MTRSKSTDFASVAFSEPENGTVLAPGLMAGISLHSDPLQMLSRKEVVRLLGTRENTLKMWQEIGLLRGIKTGRSWVFSRKEIYDFQQKYAGYDLSNLPEAKKAFQEVQSNPGAACQTQ